MKNKAVMYGLSIAKNLATIFIVIGVLGLAKTTFETAVLAGLVLIYISIKMSATNSMQLHLAFATGAMGAVVQSKSIKRLITRDPNQYLKDDEYEKMEEAKIEEDVAEGEKDMKPLVIGFRIDSYSQVIVFVMALLNLFSALQEGIL